MAVVAAWAFPSSSNATTYETTLEEDGTLACNCPGFLFKKKDQARGCKHTRAIAPYTARLLAHTLTPQQVGEGLGISGHVPAASVPSVTTDPPATASALRPRENPLPPTVRAKRRIDFEE